MFYIKQEGDPSSRSSNHLHHHHHSVKKHDGNHSGRRHQQRHGRATPHNQRPAIHHVERETSGGLRCVQICGIIAVLLALVALIVVPVGIIFSREKKEAFCNMVNYDASMRFTTMTFSENLNDKTSQEFADLSQKFCIDLSAGLTEEMVINECGKNTNTCSVSSLREGSVIIDYKFKQFLRKTKNDITKKKVQYEATFENAVKRAVVRGKNGLDRTNIFSQYSVDQISVSMGSLMTMKNCTQLTVPDNAEIKVGFLSLNYPGDEITFKCQPGHRFPDGEEDRVLTCKTDGTWDKVLESCKVLRCPDLTANENRQFIMGYPNGNTYGSLVVTQCDPTYTTNLNDTELDVSVLQCLENGTWNQELPTCKSYKVNGNWGQWTEWSGNCTKCKASVLERTRECNDPVPQFGGAYCEGESKETDLCEIENTCVSVHAVLNGTIEAPSADQDMVFDVEIDKTNAFDGTYFTAPETGLFFFSLTVTNGETGDVVMKLTTEEGQELAAASLKRMSESEIGVANREVILSLIEGSKVKVVLRQGGIATGLLENLEGFQTTISIFSYTGLMKEGGSALTVALESNLPDPVDSIFKDLSPKVALGTGYDIDSGTFTSSRSGIYLLAWTITSFEDDFVEFLITCEGQCGERRENFESKARNGMTLGGTTLLEMTAGDKVSVLAGEGGTFQGSNGLDTALSLFLYEPCTVEPVAFLAESYGLFWGGSDFDYFMMVFGLVHINIGNDYLSSMFKCRIPGIYYFNIMIDYESDDFNYRIMKNDITIGSVLFDSENYGNFYVSRSFVLA